MNVTDAQLAKLEQAAHHHATAHVRVKALALYNRARGMSVSEVARVFDCSRQSVYDWQAQFLEQGVEGLQVRPGRGRPAQAAPDEIAHYALQAPANFGLRQSRWTLKALADVVPSLQGFTPSGVKRALARAGFRYKRGQPVVHSPDPDYDQKKTP